MLSFTVVAIALAVAAYLGLSPRLRGSSDWKATVTPLASIMGSGFLVCAPLLAGAVGNLALLSMAALLALAYLVGGAIRFNIEYFEPVEGGRGFAQELAFASRMVLSGAYFVSVSYYLQLLAAFVLRGVGSDDETLAHVVTTALLLTIGAVGVWRGLDELEKVEGLAVSVNLGVIGGLLAALLLYNGQLLWTGQWALPAIDKAFDSRDLRVVLGLLIVVQGFETSRYLGDEHPAEQRIRTMRYAQLISSAIYLAFMGLVTVLLRSDAGVDVTAIIGMTEPVAAVLPLMIGIAAIGSQFSAAVADNAGAGGLVEDLSGRRLSPRYAYLLILAVTVALTWETDPKQIIAYASRAFALFYAFQGGVAFVVAYQRRDLPKRRPRLAHFALVAAVCLVVFFFGLPSE